MRHSFICLALCLCELLAGRPTLAEDAPFIVLASTTSTEQTGLFAFLLPEFRRLSGIEVRVVAVGTGQALDMARRGDADAVLVHDAPAEERFVAEGHGLARRDVMYNDFVLLGPTADTAKTRGRDIRHAFRQFVSSAATFVSRGDQSGTHSAELRFWKAVGIDAPARYFVDGPLRYRECGCGVGQMLNIAANTDAYVLADRSTWLTFRNRGNLEILVAGDPRLFNPYGVIVVNPARHPHVKHVAAQRFADWLVSPEGQAKIAAYRSGGQQLFFPNATR